jgi:hypothetical protein
MNGRRWHRVAVVSPMKLAALIVVLSVLSLSDTRAEDASARSQPQGSCMPIGLTASGELVFPWDCRAIIEKQRGPVSVNLPNSSDPSAKDQAPEKDVQPPPEQTASVPAPAQPQVAAASDHLPAVQETTVAPARPARARPKKLAAVPQDRGRQVAAQPAAAATPAPAAAPESRWRHLFSQP